MINQDKDNIKFFSNKIIEIKAELDAEKDAKLKNNEKYI